LPAPRSARNGYLAEESRVLRARAVPLPVKNFIRRACGFVVEYGHSFRGKPRDLGSAVCVPSDHQNLRPLASLWCEQRRTSMRNRVRITLGVALVAFLAAGAATNALAQGKKKSLYDRLGGKTAITAVVDEFVSNVGADARINKFFANTDLNHLKMELVNQICEASGGPCKYTGKSMKEAHKGMGISDADFGALVEDLVKALDKFKVGKTEQDELLGVLGPMKGDIVEKKM
jgi:hemoglobin